MPAMDGTAPGLQGGATWGRYVVLDRVGEGAMGVVYAAYDPKLDRRIALKVLRQAEEADAEDHARLLREAQAMARLSHPNVVAVHDAVEVEGRLHIAMEYVEGETLRRWMEEKPRSWREVVRAFLQAGRGLAAAHGAGIVHRDFKPENVLIDGEGRVRVMDFGLARAARKEAEAGKAEGRAADAAITMTGALHGTPGYMAPEQFAGRPTDARTDQFGFCVALFEALYGERPFAGETVEALAFSVTGGKVRPAPRGTRVPGWLRQVVVRGLAVEPGDRFATMQELLKALGRDPAARARRWGVGALAVALVATSGALVMSARSRAAQMCRGGEKRLEGVWDEGRKAEIRRAFLATGKPYAEDAWRGVEKALDGYVRGWVGMYRDACEATQVRKEQSESLMDLRMECLERRRVELRALTQVFAGADAKVVERAVQAATSQTPVAGCADTTALTSLGRLPSDPARRAKIQAVQAELASAKALQQAGKLPEALEPARRAVEAARPLGHPATLAESLVVLGLEHRFLQQPQLAEAVLQEAVSAAIEGHHTEALAAALARLAEVVGGQQSRFEEGARLAKWSRAAAAELGPGHEQLEAVQLMTEASLANARREYAEAIRLDEAAVALCERALNPVQTATSTSNLARDYLMMGEYQRAAALFRKAAAIFENVVGPDHPQYAVALQGEAAALSEAGKAEEALPLFERATSIASATAGPESVYVGVALTNQAITLRRLGRLDEALSLQLRAIRILQNAPNPQQSPLPGALTELGQIHLARGEYDQAVDASRRAVDRFAALLGPDSPDASSALVIEAGSLLASGRTKAALELAEKALAIREKAKVGPREKAEAQFTVARALVASGKNRSRALELARSARDLHRQQGTGWESSAREVETWLEKNGGR